MYDVPNVSFSRDEGYIFTYTLYSTVELQRVNIIKECISKKVFSIALACTLFHVASSMYIATHPDVYCYALVSGCRDIEPLPCLHKISALSN